MQSHIDEAVRWALEWQASRRVPGMAMVVTDRNQNLHVEHSGLADRSGMRPVDPGQRWQIGSISKAFTSVAVLQLQGRGELSTDDRVIDLLPWASHLHPDITLHHLMTHTAGLSGGSEWTPDSLLESAMQGASALRRHLAVRSGTPTRDTNSSATSSSPSRARPSSTTSKSR